MIALITRLLPVWAVLLSAVAISWPDRFTALGGWIVPLLAGMMFCMDMTYTLVSTLVAVVMLPMVSWLYLRQVVPVDVLGMVQSVAPGPYRTMEIPRRTALVRSWYSSRLSARVLTYWAWR